MTAWATLALAALHTLGGVTIGVNAPSARAVSTADGPNLYQYFLLAGMLSCLVLNRILERRPLQDGFGILVWLAFAWCLLSLSWAIEPAIGFRRWVLVIITSYAILYGVSRLGLRAAIDCVLTVTLIILVVDYVLAAVGIGVHTSSQVGGAIAGDWRGMHAHKNGAGSFDGAVVVFAATLLLVRFRPSVLAALVLAAMFLFLSNSKTAMLAAPVTIVVTAIVFLVLRTMGRPIALFLLLGFFVAALLLLADADLSFRNETLTGRGEIWLTLLKYIESNPMFGTGFGSFWNVGFSSPIFGLTTSWVSTLSQGHNGYLDMAATIGIPGAVLCTLAFNVVPLIRVILGPRDMYGPVWMGLIVFSILNNLTESGFLAMDMPSWFFLLFALSAMGLRKEAESPETTTALADDRQAIDAMLQPSIDIRRPSF